VKDRRRFVAFLRQQYGSVRWIRYYRSPSARFRWTCMDADVGGAMARAIQDQTPPPGIRAPEWAAGGEAMRDLFAEYVADAARRLDGLGPAEMRAAGAAAAERALRRDGGLP
jgi:hypothetical protein